MSDPNNITPILVLRRQHGLAQAELAAACGVSAATLSAIERGKHTPSPELVTSLAAALRCEPSLVSNGVVTVAVA